jgi:hypothetical protein
MTEAEPLPPYSGDETDCPKCGYIQADTRYRAPRPKSLWEWNDQTIPRGPLPERLQRTCSRCDFTWDEALAPDPADGPSVREAAADDRRWFDHEKEGS